MESFDLENYNDAGNGKRFLNLLLDQAAIIGLGFLIVVVTTFTAKAGILEPVAWVEELKNGDPSVAEGGIWLCYYVVMEGAFGLTLGKLITGTRVVNDSGEKPGIMAILGRTLTRCVPFEPFSFLFGAGGWHDRWSGTRVIDIRIPGPRLSPALRKF